MAKGLPVVMLTTGVTATTGMFAVFADTSVTMAHVSAQLSGLLRLFFRHFEFNKKSNPR